MKYVAYVQPCPLQLVELKNGETYNGHMVQCDSWMNVHLREVICTSKVGSCLLITLSSTVYPEYLQLC